jgi:glucose/arabinose dehydrogenase
MRTGVFGWTRRVVATVIVGACWGALALLVTGCGAGLAGAPSPTLDTPPDAQTGLVLPVGWRATILVSGLRQPTHAAFAPDATLYVAQLNGNENARLGQVVRVRPGARPEQAPEVVIDDLHKPTGLAWADGALYIVAREFVLSARPDAGGSFPAPHAVTGALKFNSRSNGQIATGPDGLLYFQSTGNEYEPEVSGLIFAAKPGEEPLRIERVAHGVKNPYAFAWNPVTGQMYATEIGEMPIPDVGPPPEELNIVRRGGNYGWPRCYADQRENKQFGGERIYCSDTDVPLATFPPRSTPTGLAYFDGRLIVALWAQSKLVSVDPNTGIVADFATGFKRPIALTVTPDGRQLVVVDFEAGLIYALQKP